MYFLRYWLCIAALVLSGCGSSGSDSAAAPTSSGFVSKAQAGAAAEVIVNLNAGWNAVGFKAPQLTTLSSSPSIAGAAWWNGTSYVTTGFSSAELNAAGIRRGFWVFATGSTTFSYSGQDDGQGVYVDLDQNGYQLVSFCTTDDIAGSQLKAKQNNQDVALGSVLLTTFYEVGPDNQYTAIDVSSGGVLKGGRPYWVYALTGNGAVRLSAGVGPGPTPTPTPGPSPVGPVATKLRFSVQPPGNVTAGVPLSVTVQAVDATDALIPTTTGTVALALTGGPGQLLGTTSVALSSGQAVFSGLQLSAAGKNASLTASLTGLTNAASTAFTVSPELVSRQNDTPAGVGSDFGQNVQLGTGLGAAPVVSADGRYVVFATTSSPTQIWLRDRQFGTTTQVSSNLGNPGLADCLDPSISPNGRYVVFLSSGQFGSAFQQNGGFNQVFLRDMTGSTLTLVSRGPTANQGANAASTHPVLANNGAVVFVSPATDLPGGSMGHQVYRRNLGANTVSLVSHKNGAAAGVGSNTQCVTPVVSADGRFVAWSASASDVAGTVPTGGASQIYRRDMNILDPGVELVSRKFNGGALEGGSGNASFPSISADGNRIAFQASLSSDLTNPASPMANSPFVRDMSGGNNSLVSVTQAGMAAAQGGGLPRISSDGDAIAFSSGDLNMLTPALPAGTYGFIRRLSTGTTTLASKSANGTPAIIAFNRCYPNGDGSLCVFLTTSSGATTLGLPSIFTQLFATVP